MATNVLGRNYSFPIYRSDGTPFYNLVLKKAAAESVVMSLGDKITGDVYFRNNELQVSMSEYIVYKRNPDDANEQPVRYYLVNPPTIVREGTVANNSQQGGMTKYSFEFYHPMYLLGNLPFADVAVTQDEMRYLSENKVFSWIGTIDEYIAKINKNLENTEWIVVKSNRFPNEKDGVLSEVLSFDNNTIADALKTGYDTWEVPFIVDQIKNGEQHYAIGKRFKVVFGLPSNEIYASPQDQQLETPYVFRMGKGVGLKNNSRTPRNNKIITRLAGYGSENNIPFGYPQIRWRGTPNQEYTYGDSASVYTNVSITAHGRTKVFSKLVSYPIYKGILGGEYVELIKHPFTRAHLMPSVYHDTLFNKISFLNEDGSINDNYDPDIELVDYYDAVGLDYPNKINPLAPSYSIQEFEKIKPELGEENIVAAVPLNADLTPATVWDDTMDDEGNYVQSYFQITLPQLGFDIYACAAITEEMQINMRSGACLGCTFNVQVDWEDYKKNFYDSDGNFAPNGGQRDLDRYPKSNAGSIDIIVQKDNNTFGILLPNIYQYPVGGDRFVVLGISLPEQYIESAEERLDGEMKTYMLENNVYYFDYPLKFDEYFLATNTYILQQLKPNAIVHFDFAGENLELYVKQLTIKYGESTLPQYDITLTDNIEVVLNQIGQVADDVERLSTMISILRETYRRNVWVEIGHKLSKVDDDTARGVITFMQDIIVNGVTNTDAIQSRNFQEGAFAGSGWGIWNDTNGISTAEVDKLVVRMKAVFQELEIKKKTFTAGDVGFSDAANKLLLVLPMDASGAITTGIPVVYRCCWLMKDGETAVNNEWAVDDQARCQTFNIKAGVYTNVANRYYWRKVLNVGDNFEYDGATYNYIDLAATESGTYKNIVFTKGCQTGIDNDIPREGDDVIQLGNQSVVERQNFTEIIVNGEDAPAIKQYQGINDYTLDGKLIRGDYYDVIKQTYRSVVYGDWYAGDKDKVGGYAEYDNTTKEFNIKGKLTVGSTLDDGREVNNLGLHAGNLLRNSGFTGDYETESVSSTDDINGDTIIFSDPFDYWDAQSCEAIDEPLASSGKAALIGSLTQTIDGGLTPDEWYIFSFRGRYGVLTLTVGGVTKTFELSTLLERYDYPFVCETNTPFHLEGNGCEIMDLQLMAGTLPSEWHSSTKDNDKAMAEYYADEYLRRAITDASTTVNGGLILSQILKVGNYRNHNKVMSEETGGVSGAYNDERSPFLWGGGSMRQAIYTIMKYANNAAYQATDEEVAQMAKFVVTHGGRAILNDIILRGYIYAMGGVFNGTVYAIDGEFNGNVKLRGQDGLLVYDTENNERARIKPENVDTSDAYLSQTIESVRQTNVVNRTSGFATTQLLNSETTILLNRGGSIRAGATVDMNVLISSSRTTSGLVDIVTLMQSVSITYSVLIGSSTIVDHETTTYNLLNNALLVDVSVPLESFVASSAGVYTLVIHSIVLNGIGLGCSLYDYTGNVSTVWYGRHSIVRPSRTVIGQNGIAVNAGLDKWLYASSDEIILRNDTFGIKIVPRDDNNNEVGGVKKLKMRGDGLLEWISEDGKMQIKNSGYTATANDSFILCQISQDITVTLPIECEYWEHKISIRKNSSTTNGYKITLQTQRGGIYEKGAPTQASYVEIDDYNVHTYVCYNRDWYEL